MPSDSVVLFVVPDIPGYYVNAVDALAALLVSQGRRVAFAVNTPYYENFRQVKLTKHGQVFYFSDFLAQEHNPAALDDVEYDRWLTYPTYAVQREYWGRYANSDVTYRKLQLYYSCIFSQMDVGLVVSEVVSNSFLAFAFTEAERKAIPYLGYIPARIPYHFNVFLDLYGEKLLENSMRSQVAFDNSHPPDYMMNPVTNLADSSFVRTLPKQVAKLARGIAAGHQRSFEAIQLPVHQIRAQMHFLNRKRRYWLAHRWHRDFDMTVDFDAAPITVLFPLQFRPESSTSVLAKHYGDDLEVIRNIAFSLPNKAQLIVKEHRAAIGVRDHAFYVEMLSFPGVRLLDISYPLLDNLERFDAVVTLTSTVGFEATQQGIPVYLLGRAFYSDYPGVTSVHSFADLERHLKHLDRREHRRVDSSSILARYQSACFPGTFNYLSKEILDSNNLRMLLAPIDLCL